MELALGIIECQKKIMELVDRQNKLLTTIVEQYINTAEPVGSKPLVQSGKFDLSSATIRNEMADLEEKGLIYQPHTSAGRIPTENGYRYYLENILLPSNQLNLTELEQKKLNKYIQRISGAQSEVVIKDLAKEVAELVDGAVVVGFSANDVYYTGISNVFRQPEFNQPDMVINMSRIIDHLDSVMTKIFYEIKEPRIFLGLDNPFGRDTGAILSRYQIKDQIGVFGILGPLRMNYRKNWQVINFLNNELNII